MYIFLSVVFLVRARNLNLHVCSNSCFRTLVEVQEYLEMDMLYEASDSGKYTCNMCQRSFNQRSKVIRHITSKHSLDRPFKCEICDKAFKYKCDLKTHSLMHDDKANVSYYCDKCPYQTRTKNNLKAHYTRRHTAEYSFTCEYCGKRFKMEWDLKLHLETHGSSKFICEICNRLYTSEYTLYKHKKVMHLNEYKYKCHICNKGLLTAENLESHLQRHQYSYSCAVCNKVFTSKRYLTTHLSTHTNNKPHTCPTCDRRFRTAYMRNAHMKSHSSERPFMCDLCGRSFKRKYSLNEHEKKHINVELTLPIISLEDITLTLNEMEKAAL